VEASCEDCGGGHGVVDGVRTGMHGSWYILSAFLALFGPSNGSTYVGVCLPSNGPYICILLKPWGEVLHS
jgi:hypothetical protein